jgi:hypothetical protein
MVNYQLGKVYKIVGNGKTYVGSTCQQYLCQRLSGHHASNKKHQIGQRNNMTSFQCLTDPDHYIELLELCPCDRKDELHKCERKWIEQLECVNKCIAGRTNKEYRDTHKDKMKEYMKTYYAANKDKINDLQRKKRAEQKTQNPD